MYDKMVRMKNKKGFTLVEMLVVIAVIAILVSIVVPVVGHSTQKARAATNAANLRAIEGQISTLRVEYPELFEDAVENLGSTIGELGSFGVDVLAFLFGYDSAEDFMQSEDNALVQYANYKLYHSTANDAGELTITGTGDVSYTLEGVPAAVAVSVNGDPEGMEVAEGTPMTVYISATSIKATYEYGGKAYTKEDFAQVAETGKFDGTASGGLTEEQLEKDSGIAAGKAAAEAAEQAIKCAAGQHVPGDDCLCMFCDAEAHKGDFTSAGVTGGHVCGTCKSTLSHSWSSGTCSVCNETCEHASITSLNQLKHECRDCRETFDHSYQNSVCATCDYECSNHSMYNGECTICDYEVNCDGEHSWNKTESNLYYKCNNCGEIHNLTEHSWGYESDSEHVCGICGDRGSHSGDTTCTYCRATREKKTTYNCTCTSYSSKYGIGPCNSEGCDHIKTLHSNGHCSGAGIHNSYGAWKK